MLKILKEKYQLMFSEEDMKEIFQFTINWSLFEKEICDNTASIGGVEEYFEKIKDRCRSNGKSLSSFKELASYFTDKYPIKELEKSIFTNGYTGGMKKLKSLIKSNSKLEDEEKNTKICLYVVFRYRNNFFHGMKDTLELEYQIENFKHANEVLRKILTPVMG